ncbi:type III secretion system export apparatus subunit SctT [Chthonobacter rhizosphaerae]|uniref:type III secretion system export apparatus subunit SctT n=1 Tax=Chthonobacter rhizosphaerae TaxID=2735553 RepID=UPI0015EE9188|nr:type III secretion system export apparatus subunit SctT [Chthonobacter rhizosphaerae]
MTEALRLFFNLFDDELIALLLTLPRIYAFLATSQLLNPGAVPRLARTAAVLVLAMPVVPLNLAYADDFERTAGAFAFHVAKEFVIGFLLGYLIGWAFWSIQAAGALIDNQRGAAIASSIDPLQGHESSPLGLLFSQAFLTYLFTTGAVLPIVGILYQSFALWPATSGLPVLTDDFPALILRMFDHALETAIIMSAPIIAAMFVAEFALALVSRFAPQLQVFVVAMPIKSGLAIFMLIFYFQVLLPYGAKSLTDAGGYVRAVQEQLAPEAPEAAP